MGVFGGQNGRITLFGATGNCTVIAEMGSFSLDGITRDTIAYASFGDDRERHKYGMLKGGSISFSGYFDPNSTQQTQLRNALTNGTVIGTTHGLYLWESYSTADTGFGYWKLSTAVTGSEFLVTSIKAARAKDSMGTFDVTLQISGAVVYTTSTGAST